MSILMEEIKCLGEIRLQIFDNYLHASFLLLRVSHMCDKSMVPWFARR